MKDGARMLHLLNGNTDARVRSSEACSVLDCGCAHTNGEIQRWLQLCAAHFADWDARHTAARNDHNGIDWSIAP